MLRGKFILCFGLISGAATIVAAQSGGDKILVAGNQPLCNQVTMNLGAGTSLRTNSCEAKGDLKKNLSASTLTKSFTVRKMDSVFRPDEPLLLCFDGSNEDNACFERDPKS